MPDTKTLQIGHSPDPDDAFMWYPLADLDGGPKVDTRGYKFVHVLEDIESLNQRAEKAELEITAMSVHQYAYVSSNYAMTSCGSSMGDGYGPMVVAREPIDLGDLAGKKVAIPGERTTAFLAYQLMLREQQAGAEPSVQVVAFDQIIESVAEGKFDAGVIIHEGQLTYANSGLTCLIDLGEWWTRTRGLPLPLGGNAIRRDLSESFGEICRVLLDSIEWSLANREPAVQYALNYARDMGFDLADRFVGMYVNDWTLDYGDRGREAVQRLLDEGAEAGIIPPVGKIDFVEPA